MHGLTLELTSVGEHQVGMELQAAFLETTEHADDLVVRKQFQGGHLQPLAVAPLRWVDIL
jgi:hypothetical protein